MKRIYYDEFQRMCGLNYIAARNIIDPYRFPSPGEEDYELLSEVLLIMQCYFVIGTCALGLDYRCFEVDWEKLEL